MKKPMYFILLTVTILSALGGIVSLLPYSGASYSSLLGYKALCTFNPASSLFCFLIAGTSCFFRSTFFKFETGTSKEKILKHIRSLVPLSIIFLLAVGFSIWFVKIDSQYSDGTTHASAIDE